jgi:DNA repair exonuclease SbcCD ATPase subunit
MFLVKKVRFKNFRSYGNQFTEINLIKNNSTVITAPNGNGKSSILMAIEFGLFGRVSNGINKNDLVNTINKKDLLVEIECETKGKEILIRRGIRPNVFEIFIDGKLINQDASSRDYQTQFEEEILGFNITSFRQVVSISGSSYTPFLLLSAGQRRKIV